MRVGGHDECSGSYYPVVWRVLIATANQLMQALVQGE